MIGLGGLNLFGVIILGAMLQYDSISITTISKVLFYSVFLSNGYACIFSILKEYDS